MKKLENIRAYKIASDLSDFVWVIVEKWPILAQKTIGSQYVDSLDSIAANIAEGEGRFFKKDKIKFYYQAQGSVYESAHWTKKAYKRSLLKEKEYQYIISRLRELPKEINYLIKSTATNLKR